MKSRKLKKCCKDSYTKGFNNGFNNGFSVSKNIWPLLIFVFILGIIAGWSMFGQQNPIHNLFEETSPRFGMMQINGTTYKIDSWNRNCTFNFNTASENVYLCANKVVILGHP